MSRLKWDLTPLVKKDSWFEYIKSFASGPDEQKLEIINDKYNKDLTEVKTKAPVLFKIIDDLVDKITAKDEFYTVKIVQFKSWHSDVPEKLINTYLSSVNINKRLITIEEKDVGIFDIVQNIIYQLCVAQEYQNACSADNVTAIDNAKINYFNLMIDYFENNSDELLAAFGIKLETLYKELHDLFANNTNYQSLIEKIDKFEEDKVPAIGEEARERDGVEEI